MNNSIKMLSPFVLYCQKVIPLAFDESMSYYECLCALYSYLKDTVVPAVNNNAEALEEVQKAMVELKDYVDNYFDNLDIQTEINNKLDEMAESGELASIIAQYLEAQFIYGFDTIADMKAAETLASGNICRVLGSSDYTTGNGAFYRVRALEISDNPDDYNIVALTNYPSLVAVRIQDYAINQLSSEIAGLSLRVENLEKGKKYIFIGDSYIQGYTPDGSVTGWADLVRNILGLTNVDSTIYGQGGVAMDSSNNNNYYNFISTLDGDDDATDVYICGGYNDINASATKATIRQGILNAQTAVAEKFPYAKLHIGFIGNTSVYANKWDLQTKVIYYSEACNEFNIDFMTNAPYVLHDYAVVFSSDGIHPNSDGQEAIAEYVSSYIKYGHADVILEPKDINPTWPSIRTKMTNGLTTFEFSGAIWSIGVSGGTNYSCNGQTPLNIVQVTQGYIIGTSARSIRIPVEVVLVLNGTSFANVSATLAIEEGYLRLYISKINSAGNDYDTLNITSLQIFPFNHSFNSLEC